MQHQTKQSPIETVLDEAGRKEYRCDWAGFQFEINFRERGGDLLTTFLGGGTSNPIWAVDAYMYRRTATGSTHVCSTPGQFFCEEANLGAAKSAIRFLIERARAKGVEVNGE